MSLHKAQPSSSKRGLQPVDSVEVILREVNGLAWRSAAHPSITLSRLSLGNLHELFCDCTFLDTGLALTVQ